MSGAELLGEVELCPATHRHHPCMRREEDGRVRIDDHQSGQGLAYTEREFEVVLAAIPLILSGKANARKHSPDACVCFGIRRVGDVVTLFRQNGKGMEFIEVDVSALRVLGVLGRRYLS